MGRFFYRDFLYGFLVGFLLAQVTVFAEASLQLHKSAETKPSTIIILTGSSGRVEQGILMLESGVAERAFITGIGGRVKMEDLLADKPRQWLEQYQDKIVLDDRAANTAENARDAVWWLRRNAIPAAYLVTETFHMPRALYEMRRCADDIEFVPITVRVPGAARAARIMSSEYLKFVYTVLRRRNCAAP